jgi:hypothetical protein
MRITINELRQLVKSVISETIRFDGSDYMYEDPDESFAFDFELNGNLFDVEGEYYGENDIHFDIISIYVDGEYIDGTELDDEGMEMYSGLTINEFEKHVEDLIENG